MNTNKIKFFIYKFPEMGIFIGVIISFLIFYIADNSMADMSTLVRMATQGTCIGFAAYGMSYLMITGEIDLSSGAVAGLAATISGMMLDSGYNELISYTSALSVAALVGLLNSFMTLVIGIPSFFGTLGTSFAASGLIIWLLKGRWIYTGDFIPFLDFLFSPSPFF
jgi:Ribose/xylose/arabinose/galactoside ABC-type transport systems, permease components